MPELIVSRERFPAGEGAVWSRPGDFVLVRGTSWRSKVTSAYQWGRARGSEERRCACWNHAALVTGGSGAIVEAGTAGVVQQHLDKYRDEDYYYVAVRATAAQRLRAVRFAFSRMGSPYDNLALAGIVLSALTGGKLRLRECGHDLCGGLVARALECAGEHFAMLPGEMLPADLAFHYGVTPIPGLAPRRQAPIALRRQPKCTIRVRTTERADGVAEAGLAEAVRAAIRRGDPVSRATLSLGTKEEKRA